MKLFRYFTLTLFLIGFIYFIFPFYNVYAIDITYNNEVVNSVSGEATEQDYKDLYTEVALAQAIIDGGQVDFSELNTPVAWVDFIDSLWSPILQAIDDTMPIDTNLAGINDRINEALVDYFDNGIVRNMKSSLTTPDSVADAWQYIMRSKAQKSYIGGGGTSVGETLLKIAEDVYNMTMPEGSLETYLPENYLWFQNINNLYYNDINFFNFVKFRDWQYQGIYNLANPLESYSYYLINVENSDSFGHLPRTGSNLTYFTVTSYLPKLSIYYNTLTNTAIYSASNQSIFLSNAWDVIRLIPPSDGHAIDPNGYIYVQRGSGNPEFRTEFPNFDTALNWFYQHFFNVDFYVDNVLWVQSNNRVDSIKFGGVTIDSGNNPMELNIPDFYSFDFGKFKDIIIDAINHSSILMYEDIADCFLDVNGQTCIATYSVVRNDYDDLVSEQFNMVSYPRFNSDLYTKSLVDKFRDDTQAGVQIIKVTYSIFPQPLTEAFLYCGLLVLFGLLIRRFLE